MKDPKKTRVQRYLRADDECPWCGSDLIINDSHPTVEVGFAWNDCSCKTCNAEWRDEYRLFAISWLTEDGRDRRYSDKNLHIKTGDAMNINTLKNIHKNLINGNLREMADGIDGYGLYDFWADYNQFLTDLCNEESAYRYFVDAVRAYHRIRYR